MARKWIVGREGVDHVIRYQNRELTVPHDTILWEQPPQRTSPPLRLLWREMSPLIIRDPATLEQHGSILRDWRLETFAPDRPIVKDCRWDGERSRRTAAHRSRNFGRSDYGLHRAITPCRAGRFMRAGLRRQESPRLRHSICSSTTGLDRRVSRNITTAVPITASGNALHAPDAFREIDLLVLDDLFISERPSTKFVGPISELIAYRRAQQRPRCSLACCRSTNCPIWCARIPPRFSCRSATIAHCGFSTSLLIRCEFVVP